MCFIMIGDIGCFQHGTRPEGLVGIIMQNMVLVSWVQLLKGEVVDIFIDDSFVTLVDNLEDIIETSHYTIIDQNRQLDFANLLAYSSVNSPEKVDQFVVKGGRGYSLGDCWDNWFILEWGRVKAVADFHGEDVDWIFSVELGNCLSYTQFWLILFLILW